MNANATLGEKVELPSVEIEGAEPHYSTTVIARALEISEDTARNLFVDEPGVVKLGTPKSSKGRRKYITLRVPRSVFFRVYARLQSSEPRKTKKHAS